MKEINIQVIKRFAPHRGFNWFIYDTCDDEAEAIETGDALTFQQAYKDAIEMSDYLVNK